FQVAVLGTHALAERVAGEDAELGLAFNSPGRDDLTLLGRIPQPMQVVFRRGHALQRRNTLHISELADREVALPDRSFGIRRLIDRAAHAAHVQFRLVHESNSLQLLKALVARSDVISFMPSVTFQAEAANESIAYVPLDDPQCAQASIDIIASHGRKLSAASRAFLTHLTEYCIDAGYQPASYASPTLRHAFTPA